MKDLDKEGCLHPHTCACTHVYEPVTQLSCVSCFGILYIGYFNAHAHIFQVISYFEMTRVENTNTILPNQCDLSVASFFVDMEIGLLTLQTIRKSLLIKILLCFLFDSNRKFRFPVCTHLFHHIFCKQNKVKAPQATRS